jgi:hypothetical protein
MDIGRRIGIDYDAGTYIRIRQILDRLLIDCVGEAIRQVGREDAVDTEEVLLQLAKEMVPESEGKRSSRLNIQYRVIYAVEKKTIPIYVIDITAHKY